MRKIIILTTKQRKRVMRLFNLSDSYMSMILNFTRNSRLAREVRTYCIDKMGAGVMDVRPP